jgi:enoyl-CoA hydratase/carnithine racemase
MTSEVLYSVGDRVATITLNRPEKLNAWTPRMQVQLKEAILRAADESEVRVVVVTGAGRGFCAGADIGDLGQPALMQRDYFSDMPDADARRGDFEQPLSYPLGVPKPIIAGINGAVAGVGLCFALFCDIRFIAADAKVTTAFARRGLIAEYGSAWMLPRLIGPMNAIDLLFTARILLGEEAAQLGLARLLPAEGFHQAVRNYAAALAEQSSPRSLRIIKEQIWAGLSQSLAEASVLSDAEMLESLKSADFREGVRHFVEQRKPTFTGS